MLDAAQQVSHDAPQHSNPADRQLVEHGPAAVPPPALGHDSHPAGQSNTTHSTEPDGPLLDDIRVEYHPNSGRKPEVFHFEDYRRDRPSVGPMGDVPPWHPFSCRDDFEFAEAVQKAGMKAEQVDVLLKILWRVRDRESEFSFRSHCDMELAWQQAAILHPSVW